MTDHTDDNLDIHRAVEMDGAISAASIYATVAGLPGWKRAAVLDYFNAVKSTRSEPLRAARRLTERADAQPDGMADAAAAYRALADLVVAGGAW